MKRVVFDNNVPARLARVLKRFQVVLARDLGWEQLSNGKLLEAAEKNGFDVLLTGDKSIANEQTMAGRKIGIVSMSANSCELVRLRAGDLGSPAQVQVRSGAFGVLR